MREETLMPYELGPEHVGCLYKREFEFRGLQSVEYVLITSITIGTNAEGIKAMAVINKDSRESLTLFTYYKETLTVVWKDEE